MSQFNRRVGTRLDTDAASADALETIKRKQGRVCPLVCPHGFEADGDHCNKIVCASGSFLNDDNRCEQRRDSKRSTARRDSGDDEPTARRRSRAERNLPSPDVDVGIGIGGGHGGAGGFARPRVEASRPPARSSGSGQIYCDDLHCRPVQRGCHLEYRGGGGPHVNANVEVCN